jgi:hypothetical protein
MKFGKYVEDHAVPEWISQYIAYKELKKKIKAIAKVNLLPISREHETIRAFLEATNAEITKIAAFYHQKETEALDFFQHLKKFSASLEGNIDIKDDNVDDQQPLLDDVEMHSSSSLKSFSPSPSSSYGSFSATYLSPPSSQPSLRFRSEEKREEKHEEKKDHESTEGSHEKFHHFVQHKFLHGFHHSEHMVSGILHVLKLPHLSADHHHHHEKSKKRLGMVAALEYYRGLVLLKNYIITNYTGFIKILKKAHKIAGIDFSPEVIPLITVQAFHKSEELDKLMLGTEKIFGASFLQGDVRQAKRVLRVPKQEEDATASFVVGILLGLNIVLAAWVIYTIAINTVDTAPFDKLPRIIFPRYKDVYTMFSALGLPILWTWVLGLDILAWTKVHINYAFIFEMDQRWKLTHKHCFEVVQSLTLMWLIAICLYIWTSAGTFPFPHPPPVYFPLILAVIFVFILVNPFNIYFKQARYWFLNTYGRVFCAPFKPVKFKDFFLADQLCSLVLFLVQFQFLVCFYSNDVWRPPEQEMCLSTLQPYISPVLSALPTIWRFLQSLRRYRDSKDDLHLINCGKFICGIAVVVLSTLDTFYTKDTWGPFRISWIVAGIINALYAYIWDIFFDWTLLKFQNGKLTVRKNRIYPYPVLYIWAAISNFVLRFTWSLTKSNLEQLTNLFSWQLVVVIAAAEILRKGQSNLFRLENEHLNNCGKFRAVQEIQLPVS